MTIPLDPHRLVRVLGVVKAIGGSTDDPFVIHPWYTGRDKGAVHDGDGHPLLFFSEGDAWWHIFFVLQPNDERAKHNYRVRRLSDYMS